MDVILTSPVEKLGGVGDVVKVRDGYARNFLLPSGAAVPATPANRTRLEAQRARREAAAAQAREAATTVAARLAGLPCTIRVAVGSEGQLYGSVTAAEVAAACTAAGVPLHKRQLVLSTPIRALGVFPVEVRLYPGVVASLTVTVVAR